MNYQDMRDQIVDGDLVFVGRNPKYWIHKVVSLVTKSEYVHAGIAFWMSSPNGSRRLFVVEAHEGGRRIVSLSSYKKRKMLVVEAPVKWEAIESSALESTGSIKYGYMDYIAVGMNELFGIEMKDHSGEICSEAIAKILKESGVGELSNTVISPGKLLRILLSVGYKQKLIVEPGK